MNIDSIHNGIVLDHIKAGKSMEIYKFLNLDALTCSVAIIKNVNSRKMGKKDIIKIDTDLDVDLDLLGFIDPLFGKYWAGLFCLLGHMFPCMFHFKGGKGILSGGTIAIMIDWRIALVVWGGFLILTALTRYVSLGSLWAGASFPFISWYCYPDPVIVVLAFACGGLVVWQHRANIKRLLSGTENKFSFHRKK